MPSCRRCPTRSHAHRQYAEDLSEHRNCSNAGRSRASKAFSTPRSRNPALECGGGGSPRCARANGASATRARASSAAPPTPTPLAPDPQTWDSRPDDLRGCIPVWLLCFTGGARVRYLQRFAGLSSLGMGSLSAMNVNSAFAWCPGTRRQRAVGAALADGGQPATAGPPKWSRVAAVPTRSGRGPRLSSLSIDVGPSSRCRRRRRPVTTRSSVRSRRCGRVRANHLAGCAGGDLMETRLTDARRRSPRAPARAPTARISPARTASPRPAGGDRCRGSATGRRGSSCSAGARRPRRQSHRAGVHRRSQRRFPVPAMHRRAGEPADVGRRRRRAGASPTCGSRHPSKCAPPGNSPSTDERDPVRRSSAASLDILTTGGRRVPRGVRVRRGVPPLVRWCGAGRGSGTASRSWSTAAACWCARSTRANRTRSRAAHRGDARRRVPAPWLWPSAPDPLDGLVGFPVVFECRESPCRLCPSLAAVASPIACADGVRGLGSAGEGTCRRDHRHARGRRRSAERRGQVLYAPRGRRVRDDRGGTQGFEETSTTSPRRLTRGTPGRRS